MANRRMFSRTIVNSSQFLMMPPTSRLLYYDLGMAADDDGFAEHFVIMKMTDASPDDLRVLAARGFVRIFDDKVLIITDWKENNYLRNDRYTPSKYLEIYQEELKGLSSGIPDGYQRYPQDRIGKDRIGKERREEETPPNKENQDIRGERRSLRSQFFRLITVTPEETSLADEFLSYWTEKNEGGKKERWQMQAVFDVSRRWQTWKKKDAEFKSQRGSRRDDTITVHTYGKTKN